MEQAISNNWLHDKRVTVILVIVLHFVGIMGLASPWSSQFVYLTPMHLLLMAALLYRSNTDKSNAFVAWTVGTLFLTFLVEMIGVNTGAIFGSYEYGVVLGPKLFGTPVIIGVNWFLLACSIGALVHKVSVHNSVKALLSALILTAVDMLIEPVAIDLEFWNWADGNVPLQNYLGWFFTGLLVMAFYHYLPFKKSNGLAPWILASQVVFFASLNLFISGNG